MLRHREKDEIQNQKEPQKATCKIRKEGKSTIQLLEFEMGHLENVEDCNGTYFYMGFLERK